MERKPYSDRRQNRGTEHSGRGYGSAQRSPRPRPQQVSRHDDRNAYHRKNTRPRTSVPRLRFGKTKPIAIAAAALVLALLIWFSSVFITVTGNSHRFCKNITINGVDMHAFTYEEGKAYFDALLAAQFDTPHTLTYGDKSWTFCTRDFNPTTDIDNLIDRAWNIGHYGTLFSKRDDINRLKDYPMAWTTELSYDEELLDSFVQKIYDDIYVAPVDAEVTVTAERPYLTADSQTGLELDKEGTRELILQLMTTGEGSTALPVTVTEPAVSSSDASGALQIIVQVETDVTFRDWSSRQNVRTALSKFDGLCVWPGETINFNDVVGPRTEERGFYLATEYAGNKTQKGYGGGVCQASTTLYNALLKAGMTILERWPHSMTVTYVEPSLDAAVTEDGKNLIFRNDTDQAIYIYTSVDKEYATVTIWGNRPQYLYELVSNVTRKDRECKYTDYINDEDGTYVWNVTGTPVLYKEGKPELESEGWLIAYDWDTGEEVSRTQLSHDSYSSGTTYYWRGVHDPTTGEVVDPDVYFAEHDVTGLTW